MKGKWITGVLERREYWSQREERERESEREKGAQRESNKSTLPQRH